MQCQRPILIQTGNGQWFLALRSTHRPRASKSACATSTCIRAASCLKLMRAKSLKNGDKSAMIEGRIQHLPMPLQRVRKPICQSPITPVLQSFLSVSYAGEGAHPLPQTPVIKCLLNGGAYVCTKFFSSRSLDVS